MQQSGCKSLNSRRRGMPNRREREGPAQANIVLVTGSLQGGGAERVLSDMANYWARKGWSVTLATWSGPEIEDFFQLEAGVRREWLNVCASNASIFQKIGSNIFRIFKLRQLLSDTKPTAVLSFINTSNVLTILAALGLRIRIVVSERAPPAADTTLSLEWKLLRRVFYAWSDEIVVQTADAARWIQRNCRKRAIIIPNPLRFLQQPPRERQPLIVAVGRLSREKGFDLLIRAFARIAPDFEDWNVAIIGEGKDRDELLRLRDELVLTKRVQFIGQVQNVETWMARAGLVVQPSRFEGFPNVVLESMGMGAPVISADCPSGPSDIIEDGVNGRLVPPEDVATLAQVMAELMSQPKICETLGREAAKAIQRYRQEVIMPYWEACLFEETNGGKGVLT